MPPTTRQLTILFADIASSTRLYDTFGDFKARELIFSCLAQLKELARENDGTVIKTIGDEVMCTFLTPDQAAEAARQMHEEISFNPTMVQANIHMRIGFHHGEVICEPGDVFGEAVNVAARMVDLAKSDQIITNKETLALMRVALRRRARVVDRTRVRGKDDIVEIHELIWGKPEQMTMSSSFTEEMMASLTSEKDFLQIRYLQHRILVDHERPILTMGRGVANHLIVDDPLVSRMHARIELQRHRFVLIDQSTNGTFLKIRNQGPLFLRRDSVQLKGEGVIGLGQKLIAEAPLAIRFKLL
ncbi:MAG TPA: adenylate/guanylate cyclase domain-containing protein [Desulfosarcina sp.]|nr:adenylate/guanylate cyclase domain-containing protein [Desulfosarcina sp.]